MYTDTIDLGDIRIKLDQMTEEILSYLKNRSRLPQNSSVYVPGLIELDGRSDASFLEFAIEDRERHYAMLGRYEFEDEEPLVLKHDDMPQPAIKRNPPKTLLKNVKVNIKEQLVSGYTDFIKDFCEPGENDRRYGETVSCDTDLLIALYERINIGKFVAESKYQDDQTIKEVVNDREMLEKKLRKPDREKEIIDGAKKIAERYGFRPEQTEKVGKFFQWIIDMTTEVEIQYLQKAYGIEKHY